MSHPPRSQHGRIIVCLVFCVKQANEANDMKQYEANELLHGILNVIYVEIKATNLCLESAMFLVMDMTISNVDLGPYC